MSPNNNSISLKAKPEHQNIAQHDTQYGDKYFWDHTFCPSTEVSITLTGGRILLILPVWAWTSQVYGRVGLVSRRLANAGSV